jgi:ribosomal protein S18 acetylase RimI-like enzyme
MKPGITIRDFIPSDIGRLLDFREETGRISFPGQRMDRERTRRILLRHVERYPGTIKVALSGGRPVGFVRFQPKSGDFGKYGHINIIFVDEGHRHAGVGEMLLQEAERWLRKKGITHISAEITNANSPSLDFFRGHGYKGMRTVVEKRV